MASNQPHKRRAPNDGGEDLPADDPFEEFKKQMFAHVDKTVEDFAQKTTASTIALVKKQEEKNERRFNSIERDLAAVQASNESVARDQAETRAAIEALQAALAQAEAQIPIKETLDLNEFNRNVDSTILRVNCPEKVSKDVVNRTLRPWLAEAECEDDSTAALLGPNEGHRFVIHFKGIIGTAKLRLGKARSLLRNHGGDRRTWPSFRTIAGGSCDRLFIDVDKNPCQQKREYSARKLRDALLHLYPANSGKNFHCNQADGLLSINSEPLAMVEPHNDSEPSKLKWLLAAVAKFDIDRDAVAAEYRNRCNSRPPLQDLPWSG